MSLKKVEEVATSLPDVQSMEMQILEEKAIQTCNKSSTPQLAAYVTKTQQISIYLAVNVTFKYITDARSYRHTNFTISLKRKANTHVLIVRQQA